MLPITGVHDAKPNLVDSRSDHPPAGDLMITPAGAATAAPGVSATPAVASTPATTSGEASPAPPPTRFLPSHGLGTEVRDGEAVVYTNAIWRRRFFINDGGVQWALIAR